jgi:hypothetical protein
MILSPEEKAANRAAFRSMSLGQKAEYVLAYYKLPLVIALVMVVSLVSGLRWLVTHKEPVLYVAFANVVPSEDADDVLTTGFVEHQGMSPHRCEVVCYRELYLSNEADQQNHQYAYASKLKLMAAIDAEELDVVLMNQEAYDLLSASGYLLDLREACTGSRALPTSVQGHLVSNTVVLSDNRVEVELGEEKAYVADTVEESNAFLISDLSLFGDFPKDESLYLGIVATTPRLDEALAYAGYLAQR